MSIEYRGPKGGAVPAQRLPSEWQRQPLEMGKESPQGAMKTSRPTSRSFTGSVLDARPGMLAQRALAPIPSHVVTVLAEAPGGFCAQHIAGDGTFAAERFQPGDDGNIAGNGDFTGATALAKGSASKVTGGPIKGSTGGKGMI